MIFLEYNPYFCLDYQILEALQNDFPLSERPYETLSRKLQIPGEELWNRVIRLLDEGVIRRIGVSLDSRKIGSCSSLAAVSVDLASGDTFDKYGLERAAFLGSFEFDIVADGANGIVRITSTEPVVEPFVTLLLEVSSPQGRLLREYTVLLDPPVFSAAAPAPAVAAASAGPAPAP